MNHKLAKRLMMAVMALIGLIVVVSIATATTVYYLECTTLSVLGNATIAGDASVGDDLTVTDAATIGGLTTTATAKVGSGGSTLSLLKFGSVDLASSITASTISGVLPNDLILPFPNEDDAAYLRSAVATTNTVTFTWNDDPSSTRTVAYAVLR